MKCLDLYQAVPENYGMGTLYRRKYYAAVPALAAERGSRQADCI